MKLNRHEWVCLDGARVEYWTVARGLRQGGWHSQRQLTLDLQPHPKRLRLSDTRPARRYSGKQDAPTHRDAHRRSLRKRPLRSKASSDGMPAYMHREVVGGTDGMIESGVLLSRAFRRGVIGNSWEPSHYTGGGSNLGMYGGDGEGRGARVW